MSVLNIRQRNARRYMAIKRAGDNEMRAAERMRNASSSTPKLQHLAESPLGVLLMFAVGATVFLISASGGFQ